MNPMPHEFAIGGVYMPPILIAALLGSMAALITARLLNRFKLSSYFAYPQLVLLALITIYTAVFSAFLDRW